MHRVCCAPRGLLHGCHVLLEVGPSLYDNQAVHWHNDNTRNMARAAAEAAAGGGSVGGAEAGA